MAAAPPKRLKTLQIEGDAGPEAGAAVTKDGEDVGTLTSPVASPRFGTIGLAVLATGAATDGEKVEVGRRRRDRRSAEHHRPPQAAPARLTSPG